jgi:succinate dehydrogenase / fumarate reductase cytochrome b subunit
MSDLTRDERPLHRNVHITQIIRYRMPLAALVSILHRISGAGLFLCLPLLLYLFKESVLSERSFSSFQAIAANPFVKILLLGVIWAYLQHFCSGIRHLFMDALWGMSKDEGRKTALAVFAVSLPLTFVFGLKLFGAF